MGALGTRVGHSEAGAGCGTEWWELLWGAPWGHPAFPGVLCSNPLPPILLAYSLRMDGQHRLVL